MSEVKKIATRDSYAAALIEYAKEHDDLVVLDADLAGATKTGTFKKEYPDKFFNCGIAEQNMMGVAAGLSACGKTVCASSFSMFASGRAYEIIRNSIGYTKANVKIGASHAGVSVGEDGATHQCNEDIAIMRTIPNMTIINPCDDVEARSLVKQALNLKGPVYMRFGRLAIPVFNDEKTYSCELGKGKLLKDGNDVTIVATGLMVYEALEAAKILKADGINARVINIHTIKPIDSEILVKAAKETGLIITAEEHSIIGGLGSAVSEVLSEECPTKIIRIGMKDRFGVSGPAVELLKKYGLCAENIANVTKEAYKNK